ncbi:hypothetical protein [Comamonas antarctica]|nr:hypothetical protein [Comamonas antarctica]
MIAALPGNFATSVCNEVSIMNSSVNSSPSFEHNGVVRMQRAAEFLQATAADLTGSQRLPMGAGLRAGLRMLAAAARRAAVMVRAGHRDWVQSRKQAAEDERTWNAALQDARIMADLSRAMQRQDR